MTPKTSPATIPTAPWAFIPLASNQHNEKNRKFFWGYKNHILVDCISGLPVYEITTPANVADSTVALDILKAADKVIPVKECTFIADKGYDVKAIYNAVRDVYQGEAVIPLNQRNTKNPAKLPVGNLICEAGLAMRKDGKGLSQKRGSPSKMEKSNARSCKDLAALLELRCETKN